MINLPIYGVIFSNVVLIQENYLAIGKKRANFFIFFLNPKGKAIFAITSLKGGLGGELEYGFVTSNATFIIENNYGKNSGNVYFLFLKLIKRLSDILLC